MAGRIIVSGLPASGKSSVGAYLSTALQWPLIDKDVFLEALFAETPPRSAADRGVLSRRADQRFQEAAENTPNAVLVSWWRHPQSPSTSGTPTAWLRESTAQVVEVFCDCPASIALKRFLSRTRHPGHLDAARDRQALAAQFVASEKLGPLGLFPIVRVDTRRRVEIDGVVSKIHDLLQSEG